MRNHYGFRFFMFFPMKKGLYQNQKSTFWFYTAPSILELNLCSEKTRQKRLGGGKQFKSQS